MEAGVEGIADQKLMALGYTPLRYVGMAHAPLLSDKEVITRAMREGVVSIADPVVGDPDQWRCSGDLQNRTIDLTQRGMIMGILNVTPDSFSGWRAVCGSGSSDGACAGDGSRGRGHHRHRRGIDPARRGGGRGEEDELRRVVPVIRAIRERSQVLISIDTSKAAVSRCGAWKPGRIS